MSHWCLVKEITFFFSKFFHLIFPTCSNMQSGSESNQCSGLITQKWDRMKLTPSHHCYSTLSFRPLCTLPFKTFWWVVRNSNTALLLPIFSAPLSVCQLYDMAQISCCQSIPVLEWWFSLSPWETPQCFKPQTHVCNWQEPSILWRTPLEEVRRRSPPAPSSAQRGAALPGGDKSFISHPSSPSRCCYGSSVPNARALKNICFVP